MTVPVTIAPGALAFADRLGQREEFERMIERAKHVVPGLMSIEIALVKATDDVPSGVTLWAHRDDIGTDDDQTQRSWIEWMAARFPAGGLRELRRAAYLPVSFSLRATASS
jgi:hypothetical protein